MCLPLYLSLYVCVSVSLCFCLSIVYVFLVSVLESQCVCVCVCVCERGLGVWIVNQKTIEKSLQLNHSKRRNPAFHSLPDLIENARKYQTTETPNTLGIYLLACVSEDMLIKGLDQIRREINYKAAVLYQAFEESELIIPFVRDDKLRSKTIIVGESPESLRIISAFRSNGIIIGKGYGKYKETHIRISNFPTHSKEQVEQIADLILKLK